MKLSVFNPVLGDMPFESAMQYLAQCGVDAVEIGCGGFPARRIATLPVFWRIGRRTVRDSRTLKKNGLEMAALTTHGNPVHPDPERAPNPFGRTFKTRCCWPNGWA